MPSPVGHALAGVATVWTLTPRAPRRLVLVAAALAVLPDADLVHAGSHRFFTHSLGAVIVVTIIAAAVTGWVNRGRGTAAGLLADNAGPERPAPRDESQRRPEWRAPRYESQRGT